MSINTRIPLIYGAGGIGAPNTGTKINTFPKAQVLIDSFTKSGHLAIDTSQLYGGGSSEAMLTQLDLHGARIDTKIYPLAPGDHAPARLRELFNNTLDTLKGNKIRDTVQAIDELYNAGHFEFFGLSNYMAWEVAEIVTICKLKGYVMPTVYEGIYNALDRTVEPELFPALRKHNIKFAAYSPLA